MRLIGANFKNIVEHQQDCKINVFADADHINKQILNSLPSKLMW